MVTSREASRVLVRRVRTRFIILFWALPELIDWKSIVLFNTKRIGPSSINRYVQEKSDDIYKVSVSGGSFESEMMIRCEVEF